jgi:hypothetical protein
MGFGVPKNNLPSIYLLMLADIHDDEHSCRFAAYFLKTLPYAA